MSTKRSAILRDLKALVARHRDGSYATAVEIVESLLAAAASTYLAYRVPAIEARATLDAVSNNPEMFGAVIEQMVASVMAKWREEDQIDRSRN